MNRINLCSYTLSNNRLCKNYKYEKSELCYVHYLLYFQNKLELLLMCIICLVIVSLINYSVLNDFELIIFE